MAPQTPTISLQERRLEMLQYLKAFDELYYDWQALFGPFRFPQPGEDYSPFIRQADFAREASRRLQALAPPQFDMDASSHRDAGVARAEATKTMLLGVLKARVDNDRDAALRVIGVWSQTIRAVDIDGLTETLALKYNLTFSQIGYKAR